MTDNEKYIVTSGVSVYSGVGTTIKNLKSAVSLDQIPNQTEMQNTLLPIIVSGVIPGTTANTVSAITAVNEGSSGISLLTHATGGLPTLSASQTQVNSSGFAVNNLNTLYTVPLGSKYYITSASFGCITGGTPGNGTFTVGGNSIISVPVAMGETKIFQGNPLVIGNPNEVITLGHNFGAGNGFLNVGGYLQPI